MTGKTRPNSISSFRFSSFIVSMLSILLFSACEQKADFNLNSEASVHTQKANAELARYLKLDEDLTQHPDYLNATKGLIAREDKIQITTEDGRTIWNSEEYDFIQGDAPATVNPSLWRKEKLNNIHGLFQVSEGIYQVRGYDLSNITFIKSDTGWIIVDPLTVEETARRAFEFAQQHLGPINIKAIIYTHSHVDHFGGVAGITSAEQIEKENIRIIAPEGFMEEATSENVLVGISMGRRASYMYGNVLERNALGHVGTGLGKHPPFATFSIFEPTELITKTGEKLTIDGKEFIFQYTPASEAPAEMTFYLPEQKVFCGAEIVSQNLHNLYTLRGAKVRDALKWSGYINEAKEMFPDAEVYFASHNWPVWGNANIMEFLTTQADTYKFIHDQSVRLINQGYKADEIAETIKLPESLAKTFSSRGYYGTLKHNAKAVYQHYMGWYDGNPANLDPIPRTQAAERYVKLMGGSDKVIQAGEEAYENGDYRWAAEILNHLVFAEPDNQKARETLAKVYLQLAYQAESGPWRDVYLSGANELENGFKPGFVGPKLAKKILEKTPLELFLIAFSAALNPEAAEGEKLVINLNFQDSNENFVIHLENSVLHHEKKPLDANADASIYLTRSALIDMAILKEIDINKLSENNIRIEGSKLKALKFLTMLDPPNPEFNIIEP